MRIAKVLISKPALESFFQIHEGRAFSIVRGIPTGAKMLSFKYNMHAKKTHGVDRWEAIFEHESFADIQNGGVIPQIEVVYQAWQVQPDPPSEELKEGEKQDVGPQVH